MKRIILLLSFAFISMFYSCSSSDKIDNINNPDLEFDWVEPYGARITGSFNLFPLAQNPILSKVSEVSFISDNALVAIVSFKNEIRVYPYQYISPYESVNDIIDGKRIAMTYCPITKSALCWNTDFKGENFVIRASGYLLDDNVVLYDEQSDTYWSQMLSTSIKGKYAEQDNIPFNFIETKWSTVKNYFNEALVFTNSSISTVATLTNENVLKSDIIDGESVYGILNKRAKNDAEIHIFRYNEFENEIKIYQNRIGFKDNIIVGSKEHHFITSYINDSGANFTAVQNSFPIVMEDSNGNQWDIFGIAKSGPRKNQQLQSSIGFVALGWAWKAFYDDFVFNE